MKNRKMSITMKVIVSIAAMALLMLAVLCMSGCSESKGVVFKLSENQNYYIVTGYEVNIKGKITIPQSYKNLPVREIADGAFKECTTITGITIPGTVRTIGKEAFEGCTALTSVVISNGVEKIGERAFGDTGLTDVFIPNSIQEMANAFGAYLNPCASLKMVEFQDGFETIPSNALNYCENLEEIIIPESVKVIGEGAFSSCKSLKGINLPSGLKKIGNWAFAFCEGLEDINLPSGLTRIGKNAINSERDFRKTQQKISNNIENSLQMIA